jgi:hypothetical protein
VGEEQVPRTLPSGNSDGRRRSGFAEGEQGQGTDVRNGYELSLFMGRKKETMKRDLWKFLERETMVQQQG